MLPSTRKTIWLYAFCLCSAILQGSQGLISALIRISPNSDTTGLTFSSSPTVSISSKLSLFRSSSALSAATTAIADNKQLKNSLFQAFDSDDGLQGNIYACPESLQPLSLHARYYGAFADRYFIDKKFGTKYAIRPTYMDLVSPIGQRDKSSSRIGQWAFQTSIMSKIYERGYRQNFELFGFPGMDEEFAEAESFFLRANQSDILLDLSCGSGFMTRRFIQSKSFARVIAADLSPTMLQETYRNCERENIPSPELVRCDSAKLPFRSNTISSIHAGAAMHCWPEVSQSLLDIHRVLRPGGAFYATTFTQRAPFTRNENKDAISATSSGEDGMNMDATSVRQKVVPKPFRTQGFTLFSSAEEIEQVVQDAGFAQVRVRKEGNRCVVVKALKAPADGQIFD